MLKSNGTTASKNPSSIRKTKRKSEKKGITGKTKITSAEKRYEALIRHKSDRRKDEIQRLGFKGPAKFSLAYNKAKALVDLLINVGAFEKGEMVLVGIVRAEFFEKWFDFNIKKALLNKKAMAKLVSNIKNMDKGKSKKTPLKPTVSPSKEDMSKILKTR